MSKIYSVMINSVSVNFKDGVVLKEILNQDLDTATLVIPNSNQLDIEPMDEILISLEQGPSPTQKRMLVGTINQKISKFGSSKKYLYELGLVSLTVKLQRIVLPSRSITNSLDGNADYTIKEVFENYLEIYAPDISLTSAMITKLGTTVCPEAQWNRPTLFEVFNDLLKPLGAVVTMPTLTTLSFLDLDSEGSEISESNIQTLEVQHDIQSYSSGVEVEASNVYDNTNILRTPERYSTRTTTEAIITTENDEIVLQKPIFEIKKLTVTYYYSTVVNNNPVSRRQHTLDITDRVVNKKVYDSYYPSNVGPARVQDTATKKYRRNYIYYEEGSNIIEGLKFKESNWTGGLVVNNTAIDNVAHWTLLDNNHNQADFFVTRPTFDSFLWKKAVFNVEYTTIDNVIFRARKSIKQRNESILINAQTSPIVNAELLGNQQQEFVDRIGNREMVVIGRYDTFASIPSLNDFINFNNEKFVLVQREIVLNNNYYNFKGQLSANYSMDNMFAGINTEKRYSSIASASEAQVSHHLNEVFVEINNTDLNNTGIKAETELYVASNLGKKDKYIQGAIVQTDQTDTMFSNDELLLETTTHAIGKSVTVTLNMQDNLNSALAVNDEYNATSNNQMMELIKYVDNNGRFNQIKIMLYRYDTNQANRGINFKPYHIDPFITDGSETHSHQDFYENAFEKSARLPQIPRTASYVDSDAQNTNVSYTYFPINNSARVYSTGALTSNSDVYVKRYKDNREITYETVQFHFNGVVTNTSASTQDIFVTNEFIKYTPFIYNGSSDYSNFRIAYSNTLRYNVNSKVYKGTLIPASDVGISITGNMLSIADTSGSTWLNAKDNAVSYAICDNDGKILIAVNKLGAGNGLASTYQPLYFNRKF